MSPFQNCSPRPSRAARSKMMSVSGRASPGGGTTAGRSWTSDCASGLISKPNFSASRSKAGGDRQHDVGELGRRVHEQVGMGVEIQRRQRLAPAPAVGMGQQHVGAEADQAAHGVRLALQDRAIEIAGGDVAPARRPERALGQPNGRRHAACADGRSSPVIGAAGHGAGTARCRRARRRSRSAHRAATSRARSA